MPGPLNVMTPAAILAGSLTFLWPHTNGASKLIPLALIYGASSGAVAGLISAPLIPLGDAADVGRRIGMSITVVSLGALAGPPISGAVANATGSYSAVGVYAGTFLLPPLLRLPLSSTFWGFWTPVMVLICGSLALFRVGIDGCRRAPRAISIPYAGKMDR